MFSWLKKHFIPHAGNEHRPHILRDDSIRNIVAIVIFLEIFSFLIPTLARLNVTGGMAAVLPAVLASLTNEERQAQNLPTLAVSPILNKAAEMKAQDMATKGYFAHTSPEGKTPWYWLGQVGYQYQYAGENLAINFNDSEDVTNAWMNSPAHRANIVKGNYTEIGTGVASGLYKGKEAVFVAQVYANPLPQTLKPAEPKKPEVKTATSTTKTTATDVLGAETVAKTNTQNVAVSPKEDPIFWQKLFASPRNTTNIIFYVIFGIIAVALLLYVFIKIRNHHWDLLINGFVVLFIIVGIFVANYYLSYHSMIITESLDYSSAH